MNPQNPRNDGEFVTVSIYDQTYYLRGHNPQYIERLAAIVDGKMRAVASHGTTVDSLRVAVLAALNIADELAVAQARLSVLTGSEEQQRSRAHSLANVLDQVLEDERRTG